MLAITGEVLEIAGAAYLVLVLGRELAAAYQTDTPGASVTVT